MANSIEQEIGRRRTFAIISHPDAGKTTLTEKFLLYGGAINTAGSVKGKANSKHAVSDWMEIEKERGISVTSSVLQFEYEGKCINILDTPGHEDFSEDTYRTLMAADCAVMVIDASKGVEPQTIKLFKVCVMRHIPIFTFINKMDREAKDTFDLLDDIEKVLGIETCPINWPIGCGKEFAGVYDRDKRCILHFTDAGHAKKAGITEIELDDPALVDLIGQARRDTLVEGLKKIPGVIYSEPKGAFYVMAKLPVDDAEKFQLFMLEEFDDNGDTLMFTPAESFYKTPHTGVNEIRMAYVINQDALKRSMELLAKGIEAYNNH